jgi:hypothetical protein
MTDSEITTTILRQIRDEIVKNEAKNDARFEALDDRMAVFEYLLRDVQVNVISLTRYVKQKQAPVLDDLRKRVMRLEKKVG